MLVVPSSFNWAREVVASGVVLMITFAAGLAGAVSLVVRTLKPVLV